MGLSRKREKELKRLRSNASELWDEQREVLERASTVVREAGRQLGHVSREEVAPRLRGAVDHHILPAVSTSYSATKSVVDDARHRVVHDVLPGVSTAVASALSTLEVSKDPRVREAVKHVHATRERVSDNASKAFSEATKAYNKVGTRVGFVTPPKKSGLGVGGYLLIALGVVAVVGIAYAAWQTLRADDELWVLDETDDTELPPQ